MRKNISIIFLAVLAGCNTVSPPALTGKSSDGFFITAKEKVATAYFICGKWLQHYIVDQEMDLDHCDFVVNSEAYTTLYKNTIGRVDLPPGKYQVKQADDDGSIPSKEAVVDLIAGEVVLFKASFTKSVSLGGTLFGGAIGGEMMGSRLANVEVFKSPNLANQKDKTPVSFQKKSE